MDRWAWDQLDRWIEIRGELPIGTMLGVIHEPTAGRRWEASAARKQLHAAAAAAGVRRRFAPHQLRHAVLQGIDSSEIIGTVHRRPSATISASAGLQLRR
jgi:integrase